MTRRPLVENALRGSDHAAIMAASSECVMTTSVICSSRFSSEQLRELFPRHATG